MCLGVQERLFDQSDAYRVHVCDRCGLFAVANLKKNQFHCPACKNTTGIVQVQILNPQKPLSLILTPGVQSPAPDLDW